MQDLCSLLRGGPGSVESQHYYLSGYDSSSYDDAGLYKEPICATQDGCYDDTYYLTYEDDDYPSRSCYNNGGTNHDYIGKGTLYDISGTCLGDYTGFFGCYAGENEVYAGVGCGGYRSNLGKEERFLNQGNKYGNCLNGNGNMRPDHSENEWPGYGGLDFGSGGIQDRSDDFASNSSWGNWAEMTLYEIIFGD